MRTKFKLCDTQGSERRIGFRGFLRDEGGATAIEYGMIASLIIIGIIAAVTTFSENTSGMYTSVATTLAGG